MRPLSRAESPSLRLELSRIPGVPLVRSPGRALPAESSGS
jgi:hypothetical protein